MVMIDGMIFDPNFITGLVTILYSFSRALGSFFFFF